MILKQLLGNTFTELSKIKSISKGVNGISTGFKQLNKFTSGFQKGNLISVIGKSNMGKTSLLLNFANNAVMSGYNVLFINNELTEHELNIKLLSSEAGIPINNIRNGNITSDEWIELTNVCARLAQYKLFIHCEFKFVDLLVKIIELKEKESINLIIIDSLNSIACEKLNVIEIIKGLKELALILEIPIIISSPYNSLTLMNISDVVMELERPIINEPQTENPAGANLDIIKNRMGYTTRVNLNFIRELGKFEDVD